MSETEEVENYFVIAEPSIDNPMLYKKSRYAGSVRFSTAELCWGYIKAAQDIPSYARRFLKPKLENELVVS